jgi:DNA-binding transcriptional MerR regulator
MIETVPVKLDPARVYKEMVGLIRKGRLIDSIKFCREYTGLTLKEAKDLCEAVNESLIGERKAPSQASLSYQLNELRKLANFNGLYDAADFLARMDEGGRT